jgi:hypothetical protein
VECESSIRGATKHPGSNISFMDEIWSILMSLHFLPSSCAIRTGLHSLTSSELFQPHLSHFTPGPVAEEEVLSRLAREHVIGIWSFETCNSSAVESRGIWIRLGHELANGDSD